RWIVVVYSKDIEELGLLGEKLCLDFLNTTGSQPPRADNDFLFDYPHLLIWSEYVGLLSPDDAAVLLQTAERHPIEAQHALDQAITLRETLYRILVAAARETEPDGADMNALIEILAEALPQMRLARGESGVYQWAWAGDSHDLARMLWPVAWDAA